MKNSKSVVFKRQQALLKALKEYGSIDVETIAQELKVSATTIRRDLQMFEKQNLVTRFHGGAQLAEGTLQEEDASQIQSSTVLIDGEQKHTIARYAATLID
ncbi:MAG: DeoR/GlpR transcriptional regulator, partial [Selenomonadaceae bacterium]|nr:DeoR/GlpR transcriptional regulator [Selenomonadaceae bacterium]